MMTAKTNA